MTIAILTIENLYAKNTCSIEAFSSVEKAVNQMRIYYEEAKADPFIINPVMTENQGVFYCEWGTLRKDHRVTSGTIVEREVG